MTDPAEVGPDGAGMAEVGSAEVGSVEGVGRTVGGGQAVVADAG